MIATKEVEEILNMTLKLAGEEGHEYVTPEHLLYVLSFNGVFRAAFMHCGGNIESLRNSLHNYLQSQVQTLLEGAPKATEGFQEVLLRAHSQAASCDKHVVELVHLTGSLLDLKESYAVYFIEEQGINGTDLLYELCQDGERPALADKEAEPFAAEKWRQYVECLNASFEQRNPLIGREEELERTIQILCRKDKNNPLHIGEAGVGKTAITYGLVRLLEEGSDKIPASLKKAKVFSVDLGGLLSGTQFRGDFEKRFKEVMEGISKEQNPIVYFDEIHNIVGAGAVNGSSFDVSNMLKPYLSEGSIRFIGATTYEEYKKHFAKSKSLTRRFQNVDIKEPSEEETLKILEGLKSHYEKFHGIKYGKGVLEHAVSLSAKFINDRYLPDKAIDLIDEAGAYRQIHPLDQKSQTVGKALIDAVLSKICNVPKQSIETNEAKKLAGLGQSIANKVFGQGEAVEQVTNAIKFSRAGLLDDGKPMASLLFVGPTGVGKTEVAKVLAAELGIRLIRFDMSEYAEKHTVAKLIGSPAGYVGYEEGGLLTEEIRKHPHAVLLLDEIEKAHQDIYNILLQIMDYATLTDNQGRKADFRNVILIMTSNAGASQLGKEWIGFGDRVNNEDVITDAVKRIFQPEFRNRLSRIVVFHAISDEMAALITKKKLDGLAAKLLERQVYFSASKEAENHLKSKGISREYGAREIDRVINSEIKPLLVDQLLFGKLKKGGSCKLDFTMGKFIVTFGKFF